MRRTNFVFYAPNKYFFLPPDEKKLRYFCKVRFIYRHKKTPLTIQHKAILSRVHKFFARFHLDFSLGFIKPTL